MRPEFCKKTLPTEKSEGAGRPGARWPAIYFSIRELTHIWRDLPVWQHSISSCPAFGLAS
jgi:hypothetical protein